MVVVIKSNFDKKTAYFASDRNTAQMTITGENYAM